MSPISLAFSHGPTEQALETVILEAFAALSPERQSELLPCLTACLRESDTIRFPATVGRILCGETNSDDAIAFPAAPVSCLKDGGEPRVWEDIWAAIQEERCHQTSADPVTKQRPGASDE